MKVLKEQGYRVIAVSPVDKYSYKLIRGGIEHIPLKIDSRGINPLKDLIFIIKVFKILCRIRPSTILTYTPKPNIYCTFVAGILKIPVINNVAGLGKAFVKNGILSIAALFLYKISLKSTNKAFFQNHEDLAFFIENNIVNKDKCERIPGSGVDINKFQPINVKLSQNAFSFLLFGRMLWEKGIGEYVEAAKLLKTKYPFAEWNLLGFIEKSHSCEITENQIQEWVRDGIVNYLGCTDRVANYIALADCIVLPSYYREGVPRSLLEAASMAKPIICADSIGCRDAVDNEINGFYVKPRDVLDLKAKMEKMLTLNEIERFNMGQKGREKMIKEFDEKIVIAKYLGAIKEAARNQTS